MNKVIIFLIGVAVIVGGYFFFTNKTNDESMETTTTTQQTTNSPVTIQPVEHASAVLTWGDVTIYNDPVGGASGYASFAAPNIIVLTDIHGDHLDVPTLEGIAGENTVLIAPQAVIDGLPEALAARTKLMANGDTLTELGITFTALPMYNVPESADAYHTKGRGNGYVLEKDGYRVYIAGDTGNIPEMRALTDIDFAFVPMNLPYTMSVEDAAEAVLAFAPAKVTPYHYRGTDGLSDINRFKELVNAGNSNIEVVFLDWYPNN